MNYHCVSKQWQFLRQPVEWSVANVDHQPDTTVVVKPSEILSMPSGVHHAVYTLSSNGGMMIGTEIGHSNLGARLAGAAKGLRYLAKEEVVKLCKDAGIPTGTQLGAKDEQQLRNALKRHVMQEGLGTSLLKCNTSHGHRRKRTKLNDRKNLKRR
jgi:hypothetical protein